MIRNKNYLKLFDIFLYYSSAKTPKKWKGF